MSFSRPLGLGHEKELVTSELRVPAANKSHEGHGDEAASVPVITPPRQRNAIHRGNTRSRNLGIAPAEAQVGQVTPHPPFPLKVPHLEVGFRGVKRPLPPGYGTARSLDRFPPKTAENGEV